MVTIERSTSTPAAPATTGQERSAPLTITTTPSAGVCTLLGTVRQRLGEVTASLSAATGGAALCRIDGTGGSAKHLEGRAAVLQAVRRRLRRGDDEEAVLDDLLRRWHADLANRTDYGAAPAWLDYLRGGVAELEHLRQTHGAQPGGAVAVGHDIEED